MIPGKNWSAREREQFCDGRQSRQQRRQPLLRSPSAQSDNSDPMSQRISGAGHRPEPLVQIQSNEISLPPEPKAKSRPLQISRQPASDEAMERCLYLYVVGGRNATGGQPPRTQIRTVAARIKQRMMPARDEDFGFDRNVAESTACHR